MHQSFGGSSVVVGSMVPSFLAAGVLVDDSAAADVGAPAGASGIFKPEGAALGACFGASFPGSR